MKKTGFALALAAMLAMPGAATAAPKKADTKAASKTCHELRAESETKRDFRSIHGPFGHCVRAIAKELTALRKAARQEARAECGDLKGKERRDCVRAERAELKAARKESRKDWVNAAKTCRELQEDEEAFEEAYGTRRNAFGKCVSEHAQAQNDEEETVE